MKLIDHLNWRYATKKFDPTQKVSDADLEKIKTVTQLSTSSYGLQLYKVLIVEDKEIREKLQPVSWGQSQITEASHLFVFCNYSDITEAHIDEYLALKAKVQGMNLDALKGYGDFMKDKILSTTLAEKNDWTIRQAYLALGNLLTVCAELRIDSCPMEGFDPEQYNEILGLKEKGLNAAVLATIGYRSQDDETQHLQKVRKPFASLFETI